MPKFKGRYSNREKWDKSKMKEAVKCVMDIDIAQKTNFNQPEIAQLSFLLPSISTGPKPTHIQPSTKFSYLASSTSQILTDADPVPSISTANLLKQLSPFPDAAKKRLATRARKTQKSEILTSSPFKKNLEKKQKTTKNKIIKAKKTTNCKRILITDKNIQSFSKDREKETECKDWTYDNCVYIDCLDINYFCCL